MGSTPIYGIAFPEGHQPYALTSDMQAQAVTTENAVSQLAQGVATADEYMDQRLGQMVFEPRDGDVVEIAVDTAPDYPLIRATRDGLTSKIAHRPRSVPLEATNWAENIPSASGWKYVVVGEDRRVIWGIREDGTFYPDAATTAGATVEVYDDFSRHVDWTATTQGYTGELPPALTGGTWGVRNADLATANVRVESGVLKSERTVYLEQRVGPPVDRIGAVFNFNDAAGARTTRGALALIEWLDGGAVNNRANSTWGRTVSHLVITHRYVSLDYQHFYPDDGSAVHDVGTTIGDGTWELSPWLPTDGTPITVEMQIDRDAGAITLHLEAGGVAQKLVLTYPALIKDLPLLRYPQDINTSSPRLTATGGELTWTPPSPYEHYACWEPYYSNPTTDHLVELRQVWASGSMPAGAPPRMK